VSARTTRIVPLTVAHIDALLAGDAVFADRFGLAVAPGYLDEPRVLPALRDALDGGMPPEWFGHLVIDDDMATVVGFAGFKGPPRDGEVEVGYSTAPAHQRLGHAGAAVELLLAQAREAGVELVCAHTAPRESASTSLLGRAGFRRSDAFVDEHLGEVWRWELPLA
jgi:RimJ/RimL family protein N-acetyltransferase